MRLIVIDPNSKPEIVILNSDGVEVETIEVSIKDIETPQFTNRIQEKLNCETDRVLIKKHDFTRKGREAGDQLGLGWIIRIILTEQEVQYIEVDTEHLEHEIKTFKLVH